MQVVVSEAGEKMAVVSVRCSRGRDVIAKVCRALEPLRLRVVTATIAAAGDAVVHTMFVEVSVRRCAPVRANNNGVVATCVLRLVACVALARFNKFVYHRCSSVQGCCQNPIDIVPNRNNTGTT